MINPPGYVLCCEFLAVCTRHPREQQAFLLDTLMPTIVVWIDDTFENNLRIENDFTKYLKESCWLCPD